MYHAADAAARYSYLYGPLTFLANAAVMQLAGASIFASKLAGIAALAIAACCAGIVARRVGMRGLGWAAAFAGFLAICSMFGNLAYWNRPDSFLLAASSGAVLLATVTPGPVSAILFGALAGAMVNLKVYSALFAAPPFLFALLSTRRPVSFIALAVVSFLVICLAPFESSNVDFGNYVQLLRAASQQGLNPGEFVGVVGMALVCCLPPLLLLRDQRPMPARYVWTLALFLVVTAAIMVPASKIGAGPHHLLPLLPIALWLMLLRLRAPAPPVAPRPSPRWLATAAAAVLLWTAAAGQGQILLDAIRQWAAASAAAAEVRAVVDDPAMRSVQVIVRSGVGLSGKVQPAFMGDGFLIDEGALMDMNQAGMRLPDATLAAIRSCQFKTMLLAVEQAPFSDRSYYHDAPLFNDAVKAAFLASYAKQGRGRYFDVWRCKSPY